MASKKFTCNEVLGLLFADPDSEGEYLSSEDDGDSFSDHASDVSLPSNGAAGQNESVPLHQAQTSSYILCPMYMILCPVSVVGTMFHGVKMIIGKLAGM